MLPALVFLSSCEKTDPVLNTSGQSSVEESIEARELQACQASVDGSDITISMNEDCTKATVTLSICCECPFGSLGTGCATPGTVLMQVEIGPNQYTEITQPVNASIVQGGCYDLVIEVEDNGNELRRAKVLQLEFNGVAVDFTSPLVECAL